jgi:arabinose-5-phosphate isomerase
MEISSKRLGATAVVDEEKNLLGIITDGDLRRMLQKESNIALIKASDIMTRTPKMIDKDEFAVKALQIMQENNITQLVVKDGARVAGFIHLHDLLKEGIV